MERPASSSTDGSSAERSRSRISRRLSTRSSRRGISRSLRRRRRTEERLTRFNRLLENPMKDSNIRRCALLAGLVLVHLAFASTAASQDKLPNLRALPASDLVIVVNASGNPELRFTATSWNSGSGPFELRARDPRLNPTTNESAYAAWQRIFHTSGGYREIKIGTFIYHPEHAHIHLEGYAVYQLRPAGVNGATPRESFKTSFCIEDTTKIDAHLQGAPKKPVYTTCNP